MARIVMAAFGSYGDIYPYLALGSRLAACGHEPVLAAPEVYRAVSVDAGIGFAAVRPDVDFSDAALFRRVMEPRRGMEYLLREQLLPRLRDSYADLEAACAGADLLLSHALTYAAPILGERTGLPWISTALQPLAFCSAHDPPALAPIPWLAKLRPLGPRVAGAVLRLLKRLAWSWSAPVRELRAEFGLSATSDPFWEGQHSPHGSLALFSRHFGAPQPDWPVATTQCGFCFHDRDFGGGADDARLADFLADGPAPLVITLGSSAVLAGDDFHAVAAEAVRRCGRRAVLIAGDTRAASLAPDDVLVIRSARIGPLFECAAMVVHAGGVGTTGHALHAGRAQLVVPFGGDQFDSAARVRRLGVGDALTRPRLAAKRLAARLERVLSDADMSARAAALSARVREEDGCEVARRALECVLETAAG